MGISAYLILKNKELELAKKSIKLAVGFGLIVALLEVFPFGHESGREVANEQPAKFAAIQGLYTSQEGAPLAIFAFPQTPPPELKAKIEIPGLLSWLAFGDVKARIQGINEFPKENLPPLFITFVAYHNMVLLGMIFIIMTIWGSVQIFREKLWDSKKLLKLMIWVSPLPVVACQLGWITTEVGRQPWIVYNVMRTKDAVSTAVSSGDVMFSIILFGIIYILLLFLYLYLLIREVKHGPAPVLVKEVDE